MCLQEGKHVYTSNSCDSSAMVSGVVFFVIFGTAVPVEKHKYVQKFCPWQREFTLHNKCLLYSQTVDLK